MNIGARIRARKQTLSLYYQTLFYRKTSSSLQEGLIDDVFLVDNAYKEISPEARKDRSEMLQEDDYSRDQKVEQQRDERYDIDGEYIDKMRDLTHERRETVRDQVNAHTATFPFEKMDIMDQALFCLGRNEYHIMQTPREVLFNELVELAKRFGDEGSSKLVNGIMHKVIG